MGAAIATRPRFSASAFIDDVRRYGATKFSYVGKAIAYILATPERPDDADNTLKSAFGTEASVRDRDRFRKRFGCYLIEGYGQSEGGAAINPVLGMPKGALGKPVDGVDLAVMSPETGEECPPAEFDDEGRLLNAGAAIGEIVNRSGRGSFEGYYEREDAEQERLRRGWYWTGDLGYVDADGFFYFAGRTGDWLRVDSENFAAGPVESIISRHPDLAVAAVYPVPDTASGAGDQVMVAVETVPGKDVRPRGLRRPGSQEQPDLGPKWLPRYVRVSPSLPQTATGKVTKVGPAGRGLGLRRRGVVASARQPGHPLHPPHRRRPKGPGRRAGRERPPARGYARRSRLLHLYRSETTRRSGMAADRVTRFAADLVDAAAVEGARHSRSTKQQLDHWARVGRTVSTHHSTARRRVEAALERDAGPHRPHRRGAPRRQRRV